MDGSDHKLARCWISNLIEVMNPQFVRDFGGPASFYKLLSVRQKLNPVFLQHQSREKGRRSKAASIEVEIRDLQTSKAGNLAACLVSISLSGARVDSISYIDYKEEPIPRDQVHPIKFNLSLPQLPASQQLAESPELRLLVLAFRPNPAEQGAAVTGSTKIAHPKGAANQANNALELAFKKALEKILRDSPGISSGCGSLQMCVLEILRDSMTTTFSSTWSSSVSSSLYSCSSGRLNSNNGTGSGSKLSSSSTPTKPRGSNPRSWMWPIALSPQTVKLSNRPKDRDRLVPSQSALNASASAAAAATSPLINGNGGLSSSSSIGGSDDLTVNIKLNWKYETATGAPAPARGSKDSIGAAPDSTGSSTANDTAIAVAAAAQQGLFFHYLYTEAENVEAQLKPIVEYRTCVECCWCAFRGSTTQHTIALDHEATDLTWTCPTRTAISALLTHLKCCHPHFTYEPFSDQHGNLHVALRRDRSQDIDAGSILKEKWRPFQIVSNQRPRCGGGGGRRRGQYWLRDVILPVLQLPESSDDGDVSDDSSEQQQQHNANGHREGKAGGVLGKRGRGAASASGTTTGEHHRGSSKDAASAAASLLQTPSFFQAVRQYYHSRTGLPIVDEELNYDSDQEMDSNFWIDLSQAHRMLDEFEDVSFEEKEFMKLWNTHVNTFPPYSDGYVPLLVERFVTRFADTIVRRNLRYNFLLHLTNMWDFGLLRGDEIQKFMAIVDIQTVEMRRQQQQQQKKKSSSASSSSSSSVVGGEKELVSESADAAYCEVDDRDDDRVKEKANRR